MITFKQYITEARAAPLYHGTSLENADKIIRSNKFLDATTMEIAPNHQKAGMSRQDGTSLSRDYHFSDQFSARYNQYHIIFEIDQQKLTNNYKLLPYNYWASRGSRILTPLGSSPSVRNEYEEFVPGVIENASKYVTKIIVPNKQTWNYIKASSKFFPIKLHPKLFYNGKFVND